MSLSYFHRDPAARFPGFGDIIETKAKEKKMVNGLNSTESHIASAEVETDEEKPFELCDLNDFTQEELKAELALYEERCEMKAEPVCMAYHGGPLDYPKVYD